MHSAHPMSHFHALFARDSKLLAGYTSDFGIKRLCISEGDMWSVVVLDDERGCKKFLQKRETGRRGLCHRRSKFGHVRLAEQTGANLVTVGSWHWREVYKPQCCLASNSSPSTSVAQHKLPLTLSPTQSTLHNVWPRKRWKRSRKVSSLATHGDLA